MWHDWFRRVTLLIHMCDMTHSVAVAYVSCGCPCRHDSFICVTVLIRDMNDSDVILLMCMLWLIHMCAMTHLYLPKLHICARTHPHLPKLHDSLTFAKNSSAPWLVHICQTSICVPWLIHICQNSLGRPHALKHSTGPHALKHAPLNTNYRNVTREYMCYDAFICDVTHSRVRPQATWLVSICDMTHSRMTWLSPICTMTHSHMTRRVPICAVTHSNMTWLIHTWQDSLGRPHTLTRAITWHDSCLHVPWLNHMSHYSFARVKSHLDAHTHLRAITRHDSFTCDVTYSHTRPYAP